MNRKNESMIMQKYTKEQLDEKVLETFGLAVIADEKGYTRKAKQLEFLSIHYAYCAARKGLSEANQKTVFHRKTAMRNLNKWGRIMYKDWQALKTMV